MRECLITLPGLVLILALELPAVFVGHQLAVFAHIFDIVSDIVAFLAVIIAALVSGVLDDRGREHKHLHSEQTFVARVNFALLLFGGLLVITLAVVNMGEKSEKISWEEWWVLLGPTLAFVIYLWIGKRLQQVSVRDITTASLDQHIKGDVLLAIGVGLLTILNMLVQTSWANSVGGVVMGLVLVILAANLYQQIKTERLSVL